MTFRPTLDTSKKLSGNALLAEYANLSTLHDALGFLVRHKVITSDEQIRLTRKFMDDRPEFKAAVTAAMNAGIHK